MSYLVPADALLVLGCSDCLYVHDLPSIHDFGRYLPMFCHWEVVTHTSKAYFVTCSGSGKSTLLDILAERKTVGEIKGEVLIAGQKPTQTFLRRYSDNVEQFDIFIPVLTVYEMLLYTAELKTPTAVPPKACCYCSCHLLLLAGDKL